MAYSVSGCFFGAPRHDLSGITQADVSMMLFRSNQNVLQVCKGGLRLLSGTAVLQEVAIETLAALIPASGVPGSPGSVFISSAAACDPYLLLRLSYDRSLLLCANPETGAVRLKDSQVVIA